MPLDSALYTLLVRPRIAEPGWIDLEVYASDDSSPTLQAYALHKDDRDGSFNAYDPFTLNRLGTSAIAPPSLPNAKPNPKHRLTRLFDPDAEVHLWNQPGLGWSWDMEWEETRYVWTREVGNLLSGERGFTLSASRKPDPNFPILQFRPHRKGGSIEVLDHNIARVEPPIRDRKGLEVASLLALCYFIEHLFPAAPDIPPSPAAATAPKPAEVAPSADQPSKRKKEEQAAPAPPALVRDKPAPPTSSSSRPRPPSPRSSPRIDITDLSPKAVEAHYRYCLALLADPTLPALELACRDPAGDETLKALAERIKRKRLKLSRGSDSLDIQVSPILPQQAEQARGGWFGFLQADSGAATQPAAAGISIRLSRVPPTAPSSSQKKAPIDRSTGSSSPSLPRQSSMAAPPPRKISPRPPAPPPRPVKVPKPTSRGEAPTKVGTSSGSANPSPSAPQSGGSGWLSMFGQRAKG